MIANFLKYYFRSFNRRKLFSSINIIGLAFGIAFMILIGQFIYYELKCNVDLKNIDHIYRLVNTDEKDYNIDYRIKDEILAGVPGVKNVCVLNHFSVDTEADNKFFHLEHMLMTDSNFFEIFDVPFIRGNSEQGLNSVSNIVLTAGTAKKIFGTIDVIGKTLRLNHQCDMIVSGVTRDLPENLSFKGEVFVSHENSPKQRLFWKMSCSSSDGNEKCRYPINVFAELYQKASAADVEKNISLLNNRDNFLYPKNVTLTPFKINYFNTEYNDSDLEHGNAELVRLLAIIGIIILLLAVINFINLSTASYKNRLKEFGIKKCLGAVRQVLIQQIIIESFLTTVISSVLGIILAEIFLPRFNQFINKPFKLMILSDPRFLILFIASILLLSIIIGIFPSMILSKISPLQLFKLNSSGMNVRKTHRNILTTFQFSIAVILVAALIVILRQIDFVKHRNPGFSTDKLVYLKIHYTLGNRVQVLADKLKQYHGIRSLTKTFGMPGEIFLVSGGFQTIAADTATLSTFGFKIIKGRDFLPGDNYGAVLINQTALNQIKNKDWENQKINGCEITGVISNFQYSSLYNKIGPLILWYNTGVTPNAVSIRMSGSVGDAVKYIKKVWKEVCPDYPLEIGFYDDNFASMYVKEENLAALITIFTILAIVISGLGIFGMSVFESEQRIKEIGIRKTLGASTSEIIFLLIKNFSKQVIFANAVAFPAAYYFINRWLQDFAYRIDISWWIFILAGLITLMIALATVSFHAIKAATANPVESLRYE